MVLSVSGAAGGPRDRRGTRKRGSRRCDRRTPRHSHGWRRSSICAVFSSRDAPPPGENNTTGQPRARRPGGRATGAASRECARARARSTDPGARLVGGAARLSSSDAAVRRGEPAAARVALGVPGRVRDSGHQLPCPIRHPRIPPAVVDQVQRRVADGIRSRGLGQGGRERRLRRRRRLGGRRRGRGQRGKHDREDERRQPATADAGAVEERHPAPPWGGQVVPSVVPAAAITIWPRSLRPNG